MIIYFSGCGNTRLCAMRLAALLNDTDIVDLRGSRLINGQGKLHLPCPEEPLIWMFPVYSWGVPPVVLKFINSCNIEGAYESVHHMVCTMGDDCGLTARMWHKAIKARGWKAGGMYSVQMPNTYVNMKGFDVDPTELAASKLGRSEERLKVVASKIRSGFEGDDTFTGSWAWIKTRIIYPWFLRHDMSPRRFHAQGCIGCGKCAKVCPLDNVSLNKSSDTCVSPMWGNRCTMCLACYHNCPVHAINYGKATQLKGQYTAPLYGSNSK